MAEPQTPSPEQTQQKLEWKSELMPLPGVKTTPTEAKTTPPAKAPAVKWKSELQPLPGQPKAKAAAPTKAVTKEASARAPTPTPAPAAPAPKPLTQAQQTEQYAAQASQAIESWKPQWADPRNIMKDPTWYGRSGRYFGGETVGLTKAGAQVLVGGAKLAYDIGNALDPLEAWKSGDAWSAVGKDILGTVKGAKSGVDALGEVVKAGWDIAASSWGGGDPASHADPVKFGEAVGNAAMTVDGAANLTRLIEGRIAAAQAPETAIRGTSELLGPGAEAWQAAKKTQAKSAAKLEASTTVGKIKAHPIASAVFRKKAVGEAYIDQTPIQMGRDTATADKAVRNEIETHANSLSSQIDKKYPQGSIKADDVKTKLEASLTEEVAAPKLKSAKGQPVVTRHPVIQQLMLQIKKTSPGMWTFEQTRQIREMLGRSLDYLEGPDKAVGVQAYIEFTDRLKASAKASGLEKTWNQYNGLAKDYYQLYANMIDDMKHAQSGKEVFNVLKKDPARTSRLAHGLARYGLDYNKFMKRYNRGVRIMSMQDATNRTAFYYANRLGGGLVATVGLRAAGATGYEAMIGGFSLGLAMNQAVNIARALQLTGDMNWHIYNELLLRGKMPPETAVFPEGEEPGPVPPEGTPPSPGTPPTGPTPPSPVPVPGAPPAPAPVPGGAAPVPEATAAAKVAEVTEVPKKRGRPTKEKPSETPKPAGRAPYVGPERRATARTVTQDVWAKNQIDFAREQLAKATNENEKEILRRRIEDLKEDPTLAGGGEEMGRDIRAARAAKPTGLTEEQVKSSIMKDPAKAKAYDVADAKAKDRMLVEEKRRMETAGEKPVTVVPEGERGREPGAKPGTTRETPVARKAKKAEAVAKERAEKGSTAAGGGTQEISGGGITETRPMQARISQIPTPDLSLDTKEELIVRAKRDYPKAWKIFEKNRKAVEKDMGRELTAQDYVGGLISEILYFVEEQKAAERTRAEALIQEQESRRLSPSEQDLLKQLKKEKED